MKFGGIKQIKFLTKSFQTQYNPVIPIQEENPQLKKTGLHIG